MAAVAEDEKTCRICGNLMSKCTGVFSHGLLEFIENRYLPGSEEEKKQTIIATAIMDLAKAVQKSQ